MCLSRYFIFVNYFSKLSIVIVFCLLDFYEINAWISIWLMEFNSHKVSEVSNSFFKLLLHVNIYISATINNWIITLIYKVELPPWKILFYFNESSLKIIKNAFYITLKAIFGLKIFVLVFWSCRKNSLIRKMRLISKFITLQPD